MTASEYPGEAHLAFWKRCLADPSFVYVIQGDPDTPIKVGVAKDVKARMAGLQCGNPQRLRLLYVLPGNHDLEWQLHKRLHGARIQGEWFGGPQVPAFLEFVAGLDRWMYESRNGKIAPDYLRFGDYRTWKRRRKPKVESEIVVSHVEPAISSEEKERRLHAHWSRPQRQHSTRTGTQEGGTIN